MRFAVLVMVLLAGTAAYADPKQPFGLTLGTDGRAAATADHTQEDISPRIELSPTPHHALVLRGGFGRAQLLEGEADLPGYYDHRDLAVGYRFKLEHAYFGAEAGREWVFPRNWSDPPMEGPKWLARNMMSLLVGAKVGPVDVGVDIEPRGRIGVHLGVDLVRFSL